MTGYVVGSKEWFEETKAKLIRTGEILRASELHPLQRNVIYQEHMALLHKLFDVTETQFV